MLNPDHKRHVLYGYRTTDEGLDSGPDGVKAMDARITKIPGQFCEKGRPIVLASAGPHVHVGSVPVVRPQPDWKDPDTAVEGVIKRVASETPKPDKALLGKLRSFVRSWLEDNLTPLDKDSDTRFDTWIDGANFPEWRKKQLRLSHEQLLAKGLRAADFKVKLFIKREQYPQPKKARNINSRADVFKVFCAPIFKLIEKQLFSLPWFIKKVDVAARPEYVLERLWKTDGHYIATDYETFEALFRKEIMEAVEFQLYEYMTQFLPDGREWLRQVRKAMLGINTCVASDFILELQARRMSGEMCTSLGNGFTNLMLMLFCCSMSGSSCVGVVEGDDGLFRIDGPVPSVDLFTKLGMKIKLEEFTEINQASFCGLIFDLETNTVIRDPKQVMADFAWVEAKYLSQSNKSMMKLLRCKSLSIAHQYPGCPILTSLARYGLRVTRSFDVRHFIATSGLIDQWHREELLRCSDEKSVPYREPHEATRRLVEEVYGVSVAEQLRIEKLYDDKDDLLPILYTEMPHLWFVNGLRYSSTINPKAINTPAPVCFMGKRTFDWVPGGGL